MSRLPFHHHTAKALYSKKTLAPQQAYEAAGGISVRSVPRPMQGSYSGTASSSSMAYRGYASAPAANRGYQSYQSYSSQSAQSSQGFQSASQGFQTASQGIQSASQGFQSARQALSSQPVVKMELAAAETRLSRIADATLLNPSAPTSLQQAPSLSRFQAANSNALALFKNLGQAEEPAAPTNGKRKGDDYAPVSKRLKQEE